MKRSVTLSLVTAILVLAGHGGASAEIPTAEGQSGTPSPRRPEAPQPAPHRSPAPGFPLTAAQAGRLWDGTGELLLMPDAPRRTDAFSVGATFDNSDATSPDLERDRSALGRCMADVYGARLIDGTLLVQNRLGNPVHRTPRISSHPADGRMVDVFAVDRCRYTLSLALKLPGEGGWARADLPPPPPPPKLPADRVIHLKPGETFTFKAPPTPAELSHWTSTSRIGPIPQASLDDRCPKASGIMTFDAAGVFFDMPWDDRDLIVPGVRRDPGARTTTLIFQKPECRLELTVGREIRDDDGWHPSALSPIPPDEPE